MTKKPDPKHGITGCAIGTEDVAILMDYIIDQEPQKGLVHKDDTASEDQSVRDADVYFINICLLYTSPSPRDGLLSRMPSSA